MDPMIFYGLSQMPFTKETRLKRLFETEDAKQIQERSEYLQKTRGLGVFTGKPGTGKTSALRQFTQGLNPALYKVVYIKMSTVSVTEFLRQMAAALGLEPNYRKSDVFAQVQEEMSYLVKEKRCIPLIIVDEAQYLSQSILRDLVMLLNFEMDSRDCCILVLSGQPNLNSILKRSVNEALRQRIMVSYNMEGITLKEAGKYVETVLRECGVTVPVFAPDAVEAAARLCHGSLRTLNRILNLSLLEGANQNQQLITSAVIAKAAEEMELA